MGWSVAPTRSAHSLRSRRARGPRRRTHRSQGARAKRGVRTARRLPAPRARAHAPPRRRPRAARAVPRRRATDRQRPRAARARRARAPRLPRLRDPRPGFRASSLSRLRFRETRRVLVQGLHLPLLRDQADGGHRRAPVPERPPRRPHPAMGPLASPRAPLPGSAGQQGGVPTPRHLHEDGLRLAAEVRAADGGGRTADRWRHAGPAVRRGGEPERPLKHPRPRRRVRGERGGPRPVHSPARAEGRGRGADPHLGTEDQEAVRDLVRAREDVRRDLVKLAIAW